MIYRRRPGASAAELRAHLEAGESERVAFLTAKSSVAAVAETLAAMANANGGVVFVGVTKKARPSVRTPETPSATKSSKQGCRRTAADLTHPAHCHHGRR